MGLLSSIKRPLDAIASTVKPPAPAATPETAAVMPPSFAGDGLKGKVPNGVNAPAGGLPQGDYSIMPIPDMLPGVSDKFRGTTLTPSPFSPKTGAVTGDQTVEGRMTGLLAKDNPYMQQAETRGLQGANSRGLLNSSMAVGAVEAERIAAAMPIAQQDASAFRQQALVNQEAENNAGQFNASEKNRAAELAFTEEQTNYRAKLEEQLRRDVAEIENGVKNKESFLTFANENNQQFMLQVSEIMRNPDIGPDAKNTMITTLQELYKANFDLAASVADYDVSWVPIDVNVEKGVEEGIAARRNKSAKDSGFGFNLGDFPMVDLGYQGYVNDTQGA